MKKYFDFILNRNHFVYFNILFLFVLFFNINNKTLIAASFIYLIFTSLIFKSLSKGLIYSFLLFCLFFTGKTYGAVLIPKSQLSPLLSRNYPGFQGLMSNIIITPNHIIGTIMFLWFISTLIKTGLNKIQLPTKILISYIVFSLIAAILSLNNTISIYSWFSTLFLLPFFYFLQKNLSTDEDFINNLMNFFPLMLIYESLWAFFQYIKKGGFISSLESHNNDLFSEPDMDINWFRPIGSFYHPNDLANFLLPLITICFLSIYLKRQNNKYVIFPFIIGLFALILTLSRSAWIILSAIGIAYSFILEKRYKLQFDYYSKKIIFFSVLITLPLFILFIIPRVQKSLQTFSPTGSGEGRIKLTNETIYIIQKYPLFGVGQRMSPLAMLSENSKSIIYEWPTSPHNIFLQLFAETGILSTFIFIIFISYLLKTKRKPPDSKEINIYKTIIGAGIMSLLLMGMFHPIYTTTMVYLITLLSIYEAI